MILFSRRSGDSATEGPKPALDLSLLYNYYSLFLATGARAFSILGVNLTPQLLARLAYVVATTVVALVARGLDKGYAV